MTLIRSRLLTLPLLLIGAVVLSLHAAQGTSLATAPDEPWTQPTAYFKDLGIDTTLTDRGYSCTTLTYHVQGDVYGSMQTGCFVTAAFGLFDPDQRVVIFNGTSSAMPFRLNGSSSSVMRPLPYSDTLAVFSGHPEGPGMYMSLYNSFPSSLTYSSDGTIHYENISKTADTTMMAPDDQKLLVATGAMAFSPRGSWMVADSPGHALIRLNLDTYQLLPFDVPFNDPDHPFAEPGGSLAISDDGRYAAVARKADSMFTVYDLKSCTPTSSEAMAPQTCSHHNYWPALQQLVGANSIQTIANVEFLNDGLLGFTVRTGTHNERYVLSPSGGIAALIPYLGLGDSYASGQGAFEYLAGTDTDTNACHLSARSYPLLLSGDIFGGQGHSVACSGARIHDIANTAGSYTGQDSTQRRVSSRLADGSADSLLHTFSPGYLAQAAFVNTNQPGVITVQIGGNDIGFADILLRCLSPVTSVAPPKLNANNCYQSYEDRLEVAKTIDRTYPKWLQLYQQLQRSSPNSQIYAIGYPQILSTAAQCGLNTPLTAQEITFARDLTTYLNKVIQQTADAAGVSYIDIGDALAGHELCAGGNAQPAMNGLTAGHDFYGMLGQESFHPTAYGHQLIEQAILRATHNFAHSTSPPTTASLPAPSIDDQNPLLQAPRSGRAITTREPATIVQAPTISGPSLHISLDGLAVGMAPSTTYTVSLESTALGALSTDKQGMLVGDLHLPTTITPGLQQLTVGGLGADGTTLSAVQTVYIVTNQSDYDNDGLANTEDSCPYVANSGIDADQDGLDDACDTTVEAPTTNGNTDSSDNSPPPTATASEPPTQPQLQPATSTEATSDSAIALNAHVVKPDQQSMNPLTAEQARTTTQLAPVPTITAPNSNSKGVLGSRTTQPSKRLRGSGTVSLATSASLAPYRVTWYPWLIVFCALLVIAHFCHGQQKRSRK